MAATTETQITLKLLDELFGDRAPAVAVRLWDGACWPNRSPRGDAARRVTLALKHPGALRAMFLPGTELALGEAYLYGDFDIEGDAEAVFDLAEAILPALSGWRAKTRIGRELLKLPASTHARAGQRGPARLSGKKHSVERDRRAVTYHYDVGNDFYALWLDRRMVYSCAYFHSPDDDLDTAQTHKLEYLCRKLRLRPGQRLLDIGCGWGGLALYAAQQYGVDATGITLSQPQVEWANACISEGGLSQAGLPARCRALAQDYREVKEPGSYDALVSVGMFEHVGEAMLPAYFRQAYALLRPGGVFLNHGISWYPRASPGMGSAFGNAYVFPDGELLPISKTLAAAEAAGFEVRDVESLREHYMLTLRHWVRRLEAHHDEALKWVDEPTYRVWRLFMSNSAHDFCSGRLGVHQALLLKPGARGFSGLPLTRAQWYRSGNSVS